MTTISRQFGSTASAPVRSLRRSSVDWAVPGYSNTVLMQEMSRIYKSAPRLNFDDTTRLVFISDCHRGDGGWADEFRRNRHTYLQAISYYYDEGYTYVELGDGDDLWKNGDFEDIRRAHADVFHMLQQFHANGRLHLVWGNHDIFWRDRRNVEANLHRYYDRQTNAYRCLFDGIKVHEGLVLRYPSTGGNLLCLHGHQADFISHRLWMFSKFVVGRLWKCLQRLGFKDPTRPVRDIGRLNANRTRVEQQMLSWVGQCRQPLICGHTHRPSFPRPGELPYFNTGSCIHPDGMTGLEIRDGQVMLVKWQVHTRSANGRVSDATREYVAPPRPLNSFVS